MSLNLDAAEIKDIVQKSCKELGCQFEHGVFLPAGAERASEAARTDNVAFCLFLVR